jgi:hypothetical protein
MSRADILRLSREENELRATPVGAALFRYKNALTDMMAYEARASVDINFKKADELTKKTNEAWENLKAELRKVLSL